MADAPSIDVRITGDTSSLGAAMDAGATRAQRFSAEMQRVGNNMARVDAAFVETGRRAQEMAVHVQSAGAALSRATSEAASAGLAKIAVNAGEAREAIVLFHEVFTGRFNRIPGSLMVLAERFGALGTIVGAIASPLGIAAVGATAAAAAALGYLGYQAIEAENDIQQTADTLTLLGRGTTTMVADLHAQRAALEETYNLGTSAATALVTAFARLPGVTLDEVQQLGGLAAQIAKVKDTDLDKTAEEMAKAAQNGGKAFLDWAQKTGFELNPALVKSVETMQRAGDASGALQTAIAGVAAVAARSVGAWTRLTAAVEKYQDAVALTAEFGVEPPNIPEPAAGKTVPAHPPVPEPPSREGTLQFGPSPSELAAGEKDAAAAARVTLETQVRITGQLKEREAHLAALQKLHALEVDQGREGPAQAKAEVAAGMSQYDAAQSRGGRGAENRAFQSFAAGERQKIEEARGDQAQISAIYDEWLAHAASVYGQDSAQYKRVLLEKTEAARRAQAQMGEEALRTVSAQRSIDESYLAAFKAHMAELVATHKISKDQEIGFDIQYTAQLREQLTQQLTAIKNNVALGAQAQERAWQELIEVGASFNAKIAEDQAKAAEAASTVWQNATRQIGDAFANAATDIITRTKSISSAFSDLLNSLIKDVAQSAFKSLFNSIIGSGGGSGGSGGSGSSGGGGILGGLFDSVFGKIFGGGVSGLLSSGAGETGDIAGALSASGADFDIAGGGAASGGLFSGISSLFSSLGSILPAFSKGGIVPSAAGGWSVPQLGSGGVLAQLHSQEMVLPANVSSAVMNMANNGGGSGHTFNLGPIVALDAPSVAKLFASNGSVLVAALNKALRNGSSLYSGAIT